MEILLVKELNDSSIKKSRGSRNVCVCVFYQDFKHFCQDYKSHSRILALILTEPPKLKHFVFSRKLSSGFETLDKQLNLTVSFSKLILSQNYPLVTWCVEFTPLTLDYAQFISCQLDSLLYKHGLTVHLEHLDKNNFWLVLSMCALFKKFSTLFDILNQTK